MRAVSTRKSNWAEAKVVWRLSLALVLALGWASGKAQSPGLVLRSSPKLSNPAGAPSAQATFDLSGPPLGLSLSRDLILVRPSVAVPSPEVNEVLFQVDV